MRYFYKNTETFKKRCVETAEHCRKEALRIMSNVPMWIEVDKASDKFLLEQSRYIAMYIEAESLVNKIHSNCLLGVDEIELSTKDHATLQRFFKVADSDIVLRCYNE